MISGSGRAAPPATPPKVTAPGTGVTVSAIKAASATATTTAKITGTSTAATGPRDLMVSHGQLGHPHRVPHHRRPPDGEAHQPLHAAPGSCGAQS